MNPKKIMDAWSVIVAMFIALLIFFGAVEGVRRFGKDVKQRNLGDPEIVEEMIMPQ